MFWKFIRFIFLFCIHVVSMVIFFSIFLDLDHVVPSRNMRGWSKHRHTEVDLNTIKIVHRVWKNKETCLLSYHPSLMVFINVFCFSYLMKRLGYKVDVLLLDNIFKLMIIYLYEYAECKFVYKKVIILNQI